MDEVASPLKLYPVYLNAELDMVLAILEILRHDLGVEICSADLLQR